MPSKSQIKIDTLRYEEALAELKEIISRIENGQLGLEELLAEHDKGMALLTLCREKLAKVEQQVQVWDEAK